MSSKWAKQRAVVFSAPAITVYQADLMRHWLVESTAQKNFSYRADHKALEEKLRLVDMGFINLLQADLMLSEVPDIAYEFRNDRVLKWLHELAVRTGEALCSQLAARLAADSALIHLLDSRHAGQRNQIETLRLRLHVRFALRKLAHDDAQYNELIEGLAISLKEPIPVRFDTRDFYAAAEAIARDLVTSHSGGESNE